MADPERTNEDLDEPEVEAHRPVDGADEREATEPDVEAHRFEELEG